MNLTTPIEKEVALLEEMEQSLLRTIDSDHSASYSTAAAGGEYMQKVAEIEERVAVLLRRVACSLHRITARI